MTGSFAHFLKRLVGRDHQRRRRGRSRPRPAPYRPSVEILEDRNLLDRLLGTADVIAPDVSPSLPEDATEQVAPPAPIQISVATASGDDMAPVSVPAPVAESDSDSGSVTRPDTPCAEDAPPIEHRPVDLERPFGPDAMHDDALDDPLSRVEEPSSGGGGGNAPSLPASGNALSGESSGTGAASGAGSLAGASNSEPPPLAQNTAGHDAQTWNPLATGTAPATAAVHPTTAPAAATSPAQTNPSAAPVASGSQGSAPAGSGGLAGIDPSIAVVEGSGFSGTVAQFTDSDGNINPYLYSSSINWGDGTGSSGGMVTYAAGTFSVQSIHSSYQEEGTFTVTTSVTDNADHSTLTITSPATVTDAALNAGQHTFPSGVHAGTAFSAALATFQDANSGGTLADYNTPTITWGDGTAATTGTLTSSSGNITVNGSHTYVAIGSYTITINGVDDGGATVTFQDTGTAANPVSLSNPGTQSSTEGGTASLMLSGSDAAGHALTYDASGLPPGLKINPSNGQISGTVALGASAAGPYAVSATASDGTYSNSVAFTWNVSSPITLTNPGNQTSTEGATASLALSASDFGGTLSYAASGLPPGLAINTSTGAITGTVAVGTAASGPYSVTATASDGTSSTSQTFTWTVNSPVTLAAPPAQTSTEGATVSLSLSGSDSSSGTLAYSATGLPPGLAINTSTGAITGTLAAGAAANGPYTITVTAGDSTYSASQSFTWTVTSPVSITAPAAQANNEGDTVALSIGASDSSSGTLTYGATGLPGGLSINAGTGQISGTVAAGAAAQGPYTVTLVVGDGTFSAQTSFTWTVNSPLSITPVADQGNAAGNTVSLAVQASGSGTLGYAATGLPPGLAINATTGAITGTLGAGGAFTPTVTVSNSTSSASVIFNWTVSCPITISAPGTQTFNAGDAVSLQIHASDTVSGTLSYAATGLPGGLGISSSTGLISGTIGTSVSAGIYTSTLTVSDGSNTAQLSFAWIIYPTSLVIVTNPGTKSNAEGDAVSLSLSTSYSGSGTLKYAAGGLPPGLSINPSSGAITGTVSAAAAALGPFVTTVTATDGTASDSQSFIWNVNGPIALTNPGTQNSTEGSTVSLSLSASYSGSGSLTYSALGLPGGLALNPSTGVIAGTLAAGVAAAGLYSVTVQAAVNATTSVQTFTWNVSSPITLTTPGDQTSSEGNTVALSLSATDSTSGTLSYSAGGLPPGLAINPSTGAITGTVAVGAAGSGPYSVTVVAQDGTYRTSQTFTWTVNRLVTITAPTGQTNNEGDTVSLTLSASDSTSGTLKYTALGLPPGLVLNPNTGAISGAITVGAAANAPYTVTVAAADGTYSAQTTFTWNVNSPISITTLADQANNAGSTVSLPISASGSGTLVYAASGLPNGLSINASTGAITGTLSAGGSFTPTVTVGNGTYSNSVTFRWTVSSPITITDPGKQSNSVGNSVSVSITATDTATGTLVFSATGLPNGLSISSSTGLITGTVSSGALSGSPFTTTVTVSDGTNTAVDSFPWTISPAGAVVLANPGSQSNAVGDADAFFLQASDSSGGTLMYSTTGLPPGEYLNAFTGLVFGTLSSAALSGSPYAVTVEASDGTNAAMQTFTWAVHAAGTVTLTNPGDQTSSEGTTVSLALTASDSSSGTLRYVAVGLPSGLALNTSTGAISGTVALGAAARGPYTVSVVANDGTYSASQTFAWNITSAVTLAAPANQSNREGDTISLSLSGSDSSSGTLSYAAQGLPPGLKINPSTGAITGTVAKGAAASGPYSVTVVAADGTSSASQTFTWTITSPVTIATPADQTNKEGDAVSLAVSASGGGTLKYAAVGLPAGLAINASTGVISGTVARGDSGIGVYAVTVNASDGTSSSSTSLVWHVSSAVSITDPGSQANVVGDTVSLQVAATDSSGTLVYAASGLPTGLSINASTGLISGTLSSGATAIGTFSTTVTVADGTATASDTFPWRVSAAGTVTLTTPRNQRTAEGSTVSLTLSARDSSSGTLRYFAANLPPGLKINPSTGVISGTVAPGAAAEGPYVVTVIATNGTYRAFATFPWTVTSAVTLAAVSNQTTREGTAVSLSLSGSDSSSGTVYYGAVGLPPGLTINTSTGAIAGTVALGAAAAGAYAVTVTAGDSTSSATQTFTWTSSSPITLAAVADQTNTEGDTVAVSLSGSDASSGTLSYAAVGLPPGLKINASTGAITGTVAVGASVNSPYSIVVTASDGTYSASQAFTWNVNNPISITDPGVQNVSAGSTVNLQIQSSDSHTGTLSYYAFNLPVGLSINAATGLITGTIGNAATAAGTILSTIKVTDGTYSAGQTVVWTVLAQNFGLVNAAAAAGILAAPQAPLNKVYIGKGKSYVYGKIGSGTIDMGPSKSLQGSGFDGTFKAPINWHLTTPAGDKGGVIVQYVTTKFYLFNANGDPIDLAQFALKFQKNVQNWSYLEYWEVPAKTTKATSPAFTLTDAIGEEKEFPEGLIQESDKADDTFAQGPIRQQAKAGIVVQAATAYYFPNLSKKDLTDAISGFKPGISGGVERSGVLPSVEASASRVKALNELRKEKKDTVASVDHVVVATWGWNVYKPADVLNKVFVVRPGGLEKPPKDIRAMYFPGYGYRVTFVGVDDFQAIDKTLSATWSRLGADLVGKLVPQPKGK